MAKKAKQPGIRELLAKMKRKGDWKTSFSEARKIRITLAQMAIVLNHYRPDLLATVEEGYCNTDRHPKGVRWRVPGKGRVGTKLVVVKRETGRKIYSHNAAETYRRNYEAARDLVRLIRREKLYPWLSEDD